MPYNQTKLHLWKGPFDICRNEQKLMTTDFITVYDTNETKFSFQFFT